MESSATNDLEDHFEPQFLLGMTATPERTDGNDIFKLFDHNIFSCCKSVNSNSNNIASFCYVFSRERNNLCSVKVSHVIESAGDLLGIDLPNKM